ncbi:N(5)-(carboxyethyl)ornithine synthase [Microbacterium sp. zg.Y1090]|uniref:N(5)-(carboxyethyl)ornithine synthase n=1 Tax=Microbacterium TaxID=33882 RepID=UPI00214BE366|nr:MULTISPECIES: N(5)-(carboxyethyl)ornithine synthase [unclassified Microbacterium]MCR2813410.1 N(5)-(carboxyethyl)ornithine synthase [Microbacterium sp. zg.Y1084]MCR2818254.1 N(5)-(carboxyethyl)ornithine synthase [Microbacterium sp. zg.Y1090]WIM27600.1 N(5)-(carboxyethyl)ornithine synthase [Microbacterium sp. zg-Y1090]
MAAHHPHTLGVVGASLKPDEHRVPLHPGHLERIPDDLRPHVLLEAGYGERFGVPDEQLRPLVGGVLGRDELFAAADVLLLPKPQHADVQQMRDGQTLWGWPHLVQDEHMTQLALDKSLTMIAFEAMNHWGSDGTFGLHVFHKNNELAGYCSVIHALQLCGSTGDYGRRLSAVVIGFGATARGAVTALHAHGIHDVRVLTNRAAASVAAPIHATQISQFDHDGPYVSEVITDEGRVPLAPFLAESDIVVNCTLQDPNHPLLYLRIEDLAAFRDGSLIVDVSCDEGMGFEWARPTGFADPMFTVGGGINYYAVDHSPSYLWNSASWEISEALLPFLPTVMAGPQAWASNETIARAIEVRDGEVLNPAILEFQHRLAEKPYAVQTR